MQISPIQQTQNYKNNNFKGTVSNGTTQLIDRCTRNEVKRYTLSLEKGVNPDSGILQIKKAWDTISQTLNKKLEQMHPTTILDIYEEWVYGATVLSMKFENKDLAETLSSPSVYKGSFGDEGLPNSEQFGNLVANIIPKEIDKAILNRAVENTIENCLLPIRYSDIKEYQDQLKFGTISLKEAEQNLAKINKALFEFNKKNVTKNAENLGVESKQPQNLEYNPFYENDLPVKDFKETLDEFFKGVHEDCYYRILGILLNTKL